MPETFDYDLDVCQECGGTGDDDVTGMPCWRCHGHGDVQVWLDDDDEDGGDDA